MQKLQNDVATVVVLVLVLMLVVGLGFGFSCGRLLLVTIFLLYQISFCPTFHPSMFVISMSNSPQKMLLNEMTPAGLEPAIPGSVGRCLIHWATGPMMQALVSVVCNSKRFNKNKSFGNLSACFGWFAEASAYLAQASFQYSSLQKTCKSFKIM